jgi:hypothetical protein
MKRINFNKIWTKLLNHRFIIQFASALLFSFGVLCLLPAAGDHEAAIAFNFFLRVVLASITVVFVVDVLIFRRRLSYLGASASLIAGFFGFIVGGFLPSLIKLLSGVYEPGFEVIGMFGVSILSIVLSYNAVEYLSRKKIIDQNKLSAQLICAILLSYSLFFSPSLFTNLGETLSFTAQVICLSFGTTIGIVLPDMCFGRGYKFNILAVSVALILGASCAASWIIIFRELRTVGSIIVFFPMVILPPLIGYNAVILWRKKDTFNVKETGK